MKVLIQWSLSNPGDWEEIDSSEWARLSKKPEPRAQSTIDNQKGWIHGLCIQGLIFQADHYHIEEIINGIRVTVWNDDPVDWPIGMRHARVWDILNLDYDPNMNGAINTRQSQIIYGESNFLSLLVPMQNTIVHNWSEFTKPKEKDTLHGIETENNLHLSHLQKRSKRGWREWTEGLNDSEIENGEIKTQRSQGRYVIPDGTRTYYQRDTNRATSVHAATNEDAFELTTATSNTETASPAAGSSVLGWTFTTPTDEPNEGTWPIGSYRCQLDVTANGADNQYGLLALGSVTGHFGRVNDTTIIERKIHQQVESAFTGTGLKLATTGSVDFSAVSAGPSDRFECAIAVQNTAAHGGAQDTTLRLNTTDSFADGPWPSLGGGGTPVTGGNSVLFAFGGI